MPNIGLCVTIELIDRTIGLIKTLNVMDSSGDRILDALMEAKAFLDADKGLRQVWISTLIPQVMWQWKPDKLMCHDSGSFAAAQASHDFVCHPTRYINVLMCEVSQGLNTDSAINAILARFAI